MERKHTKPGGPAPYPGRLAYASWTLAQESSAVRIAKIVNSNNIL